MTELKVCVLGDSGVGKTSLLYRIARDVYVNPDLIRTTLQCDFFRKTMSVSNEEYRLVLWEMSVAERFINEVSTFFTRGACPCLLVFAQESFYNWLESFKKNMPIDNRVLFPFVLVDNKADVVDRCCIDKGTIESFCDSNESIPYMEISAKTGSGVHEAFKKAVELFHDLDSSVKKQLLGKHTALSVQPVPEQNIYNLTTVSVLLSVREILLDIISSPLHY